MKPTRPSANSAHVVAWTSVLLAFGVTQGVIYLKSFWGKFGLDPFQFSNASDLAIVGLTGIGVTLAFVAGAALLGGYLGAALVKHTPRSKIAIAAVLVPITCGIISLALFVDFGIYLLLGMLFSWVLMWLVHHSPDIPESFKQARIVGYLSLAVTYVPMASYYYGQRKANTVISTDRVLILSGADRSQATAMPPGKQRLVGRLGGEYVFYNSASESVTIVQASSVNRMTLTSAYK